MSQENVASGQPREVAPVTVRFVCPLCGGPHHRADHPSSQ
jgi:hypothetical protein